MSLASTLREAADQNRELLAELAATDYAPSSLAQNTSYIQDLKSQIANTDKELKKLHAVTEDERKDHIKYRDSNVKRWAHKLQGSKGKDKFISKQEKEEREFLEAWQKERSAQESRAELSRALEKAEGDRTHLEADTMRQNTAQQSLDQLYSSIFSGPTPDIPGEDDLEQQVQQARTNLDQIHTGAGNEKRAFDALGASSQNLDMAAQSIDDALRRSTRDMFGGGTFTDMMERDALAQAQMRVNNTLRGLSDARKYQSAIRELPEISIDQGHFFSDVMFDNIFTDMAQHERIQGTERQVNEARRSMANELGLQSERCRAADGAVKQAKQDLEARRRDLQIVRSEAFERFAQGSNDSGVPPAYQAMA